MKACVINFADGIFVEGQKRLAESLRTVGFTGDVLLFNTLIDWPSHQQALWGFKVYAFEQARKQGYDVVLWIDSSGMAVKSPEKLFALAEKNGVAAFSRFSASVGEWSSDLALERLGVTREEAFHIPEISAYCIAIDFRHKTGQAFFEAWKKYCLDGETFLGVRPPLTLKDAMTNENGKLSAHPRVRGHRGDQTVASVIVHTLHIPLSRRYAFDLLGEAPKGIRYAPYLPLDAIIAFNRDIKESNPIMKNLSGYKTSFGSIIYTGKRYAKDFIKSILWNIKKS